MYFSDQQLQKLKNQLQQQTKEAFAESPDLSGVVHGRRRITQGARGRRTALFPSCKNGVTIALESQIETPYCLLLERNPHVIGYRCQSLEIEYSAGRRYFSDFLIKTDDDRWLVTEIKPDRKQLSEEIQHQHKQVEKLLCSCGFEFSVVGASNMPGKIPLENLYYLYQRSKLRTWSAQECELAIEYIAAITRDRTLGNIYRSLSDAGLSVLIADHLIFHGRLVANLNRPLLLDARVEILQ